MMIRKGMFIGDRYEIIDKVGSGGMSDVYKALDHKLNRHVAIKILKEEFSEDKGFVSKFKAEAQSAAGLAHPNIVNVFDVGEEGSMHFIVMELVEGITLKKYITKKGKIPVKEAVSIAIQIAQGIEAAHNNHIIHRDIKPQNVIISREGKVKVTDFGIARAASSNTINSNAMGSVHYISPEQTRGGYIDEKSDIYSLGISLYEMLTGKLPFEGETTVAIALQHINEELPSVKAEVPDLPVSVEKILDKCTQKKAERRYLKVSALIADLKKSLMTPDDDFVVMTPVVNNDATIMITDEEVSIIRKNANMKDDLSQGKKSSVENHEKKKDVDFDDDIDAANPKFDRIVTIGAIVASVVVLIVFILILVNMMKGCDSSEENPYETETSTSGETQLSDTQTIVPDVVGMTAEEAKQTLNNKSLGIQYEYEYDITVPKGYVIRQSVVDGTVVDKHTKITVTVSNGAEQFDIPSVSGLTREQALTLLQDKEKYGLNVSVEYQSNDDIAEEICIGTNPTSPVKLTYGESITLIVSSGVDDSPVEFPNVVGKTKAEAEKILTELGLTVEYNEANSETVEEGKVISAEYQQGQSIPKGTTVGLTISTGRPPETTTPEPTTEIVKKTEVTIKEFNDGKFEMIPQISYPVEGSEEGETQLVDVTSGKLTASLIVKHDGMTTTMDVTDYIVASYETGYTQNKITITIDILNVTDVTFMVTLTYEDSDGSMKDVKVYQEDDCNTEEVELVIEG